MKKRNELPDINLDVLPFVAFEDRANLPPEPCIYFVRDTQGVVLYIGKATNARSRWSGKRHSIYDKLSEMSRVTITYLLCPYIDCLNEIEKAFIVWFCPELNDKCTPQYRLRGRELNLVHTLVSVLVQTALSSKKQLQANHEKEKS